MKIAVIGGGLFGCTIAAQLKSKHDVHLFEEKDSILRCASFVNQYRLHRGYHYPRSLQTMVECRRAATQLTRRWPEVINSGGRHIYAIARNDSRTRPDEYLAALDSADLSYQITSFGDILNPETVEMAVEVQEDWLDVSALRGRMWRELRGVTVNLNAEWDYSLRDDFDLIVLATYAKTNEAAMKLDCAIEPFQYEVVEKPVIQMPSGWEGLGVVVMDGPFCSVDPFGHSNLHVMGHVTEAILHRSVGPEPEIPEGVAQLINAGVVTDKGEASSVWSMIQSGSKWIPTLKFAKYIGSMFTVRAVLPDVDATDERPTIVSKLDDQVIRVFSGKLAGCIQAAEEVENIADGSDVLVGRRHAA